MPYLVITSKEKRPRNELERLGCEIICRYLWFVPRDKITKIKSALDQDNYLLFQKTKIKKSKLERKGQKIGFTLIAYDTSKSDDKGRKAIKRVLSKAPCLMLAKSIYIFPYIEKKPKIPDISTVEKVITENRGNITKIGTLIPIEFTTEKLRERAKIVLEEEANKLMEMTEHIATDETSIKKHSSQIRASLINLKLKSKIFDLSFRMETKQELGKKFTKIYKTLGKFHET